MNDVPTFTYFPNPLENECMRVGSCICPCCNATRPHMYVGPMFHLEEPEEVCLWCIASGLAADRWNATFCSVHNAPAGVPETIK